MLKSILSLLIVATLMILDNNAFCQDKEDGSHLRNVSVNEYKTDAVPSISLKNRLMTTIRVLESGVAGKYP